MSRAYLGLGSNLGHRLANLQGAVASLRERGVRTLRSSRIYETDPVGGAPQPDYLNAVIQVETDLEPRALLEACKEAEREIGRVPGERWGPRAIDIDILTYDDREVDEPDLRIPHPRMHERGFVLMPLLELDADPPLPEGRKISTLRLGASAVGGARLHAPPLAVGD